MNGRILIVDDEEDIRETLRETLLDEDYQVETASDGNEALQKAQAFKPDIVLLDVMMPEQDGWLVCAKLKVMTPSPKIAVVTAMPIGESDRFADFVHSDAILHKPFTFHEIIDLVRRLRGSIQGQEAAR